MTIFDFKLFSRTIFFILTKSHTNLLTVLLFSRTDEIVT